MSGNYFPIFKPTSAKPVGQEVRPSPRKEKDTSADELHLHCMICYKSSYDLEFSKYILNDDAQFEQSSNLFQNYVSLLCVQLVPSMQWDFRSEVLPFCKDCLLKVKNLTVLQNKLTFVLKSIKKSVLDMKVKILESQKTISANISLQGKEVVGISSSTTASKHQEKVDHFRSLVVKEFNPDVVLSRDKILKKKDATRSEAKFSEMPVKMEVSMPSNHTGVEHFVDKIVESGPDSTEENEKTLNHVSDVSLNDDALKINLISELNTETVTIAVADNIFEKNVAKELRSCFVKKREVSLSHENILQELVIFHHDERKTADAEAQTNFRRIGNNNWQCKLCKKRFTLRGGRNYPRCGRHLDEVHKNVRPYQCRLCMHRFYNRYKCNRHIKSAHVHDLAEILGISSETLPLEQDITTVDGIRTCATKSGKMQRSKLEKADGTDSSMQIQVTFRQTGVYQTFYTKTSNHYKCKFCASKIMFPGSLKRHFISYHGPLEKFKCQHCQRIFTSERMHAVHLKANHSNIIKDNINEDTETTAGLISKDRRPELPLQSKSININKSGYDHKQSGNKSKVDMDDSCSLLNDSIDSEKPIISTNSNIFEKSSPEKLLNSVNDGKGNGNSMECELSGNENVIGVKDKAKSKRCKSKLGNSDSRNYEYPPHIERGIVNACENDLKTNINEYFEDTALGGKVRCKVCNIVITRNKRHRHYITVHNKRVFRYACKYCHKKFYYKSECALHIRVSHYMEKPFQCSKCNMGFTTVNSRAIHYRKCSFLSSVSK